MKRLILFSLFIGSFMIMTGQQQLENPSFESWDNSDASDPYNEPQQWSSIKTSDAGNFLNSQAPHVASRSTDAHSGSYSLRLENKSAFGIVANGIVTNGRVHADVNPENGYVFTDASDAQWNTSFTSRPDSLVGWYKYDPASTDKGKVEMVLHTGTSAQLPENGTAGSFVGAARFDFPNTTISSWTRFSVPFNYFNASTPDYALTVVTSGDSTLAKNGSIAFVDDLELIYNPVSVDEQDVIDFLVSFNQGYLNINLREDNGNGSVQVFDLQGREVGMKQAIHSGSNQMPFDQPKGCYIIRFELDGRTAAKKFMLTE